MQFGCIITQILPHPLFLFHVPTALAPFWPLTRHPTRYVSPRQADPADEFFKLAGLAARAGDFAFGAAALAGCWLDLYGLKNGRTAQCHRQLPAAPSAAPY